ncbi:MAG: hypothetical protein Kow0068_20450 [Marinilabiliales bacterium]
MSKKIQTKKAGKDKPQKQNDNKKDVNVSKTDNSNNKFALIVLFILSFVLYGNTLFNDYALDDAIVITQNNFTRKGVEGIKGIFSYDTFTGFWMNSYPGKTAEQIQEEKKLVAGGRYRPLSLLTFALENEIFGTKDKDGYLKGNPLVSHFFNILLYYFTVVLLYVILLRLLPKAKKWYLSLPFIISVLFLAHPIHTEAVANIKGRDEIMTLLGSLLALWYTIKYLDFKKTKYLLFSSISLFLGLLSKENAITFLALIPLTVYYFTNYKFKEILKSLWPLLIASGLFLLIRGNILGVGVSHKEIAKEIMNNPFLNPDTGQEYGFVIKMATIFITLLMYIKLLFFPVNLTYDYYPYQIKISDWSNPVSIISLIIYLALGAYAVYSLLKRKNLIGYGIWFYLIPLSVVSNIVFPVGTFMNERFVFISSIGYCIIIAYILIEIINRIVKSPKNANSIIIIIFGAIVFLYGFKTIDRNKAWKNDYTLFTNDVEISTNSAKSNSSAGGKITEEVVKLKEIRAQAQSVDEVLSRIDKETLLTKKEKEEFYKAKNLDELKSLMQTKENEMIKKAVKYLEKSVSIHPKYVDALLLLGNAYYHDGKNYPKLVDAYLKILEINPNYDRVYKNLIIVFGVCEDVDFKIETWKKIEKINPARPEVYHQLGILYGQFKNDLTTSIKYLEKAKSLQPNNSDIAKDLGTAYGIAGFYDKALNELIIAYKSNQNDENLKRNIGITYQKIAEQQIGNKNYDLATENLKNAEKYIPGDPMVLIDYAIININNGDKAKGIEQLTQAIIKSNGNQYVAEKAKSIFIAIGELNRYNSVIQSLQKSN